MTVDQTAPKETTRERVVRVGTELFATNGYHATGITELSEAVGLGRGALYHHISSKEALLFEISMALLGRMIEEGGAIAGADLDPEVKLRTMARSLIREQSERRDAWTLVIDETRALDDDHREQVVRARDQYEALWSQIFDETAAAGVTGTVDGVELRGFLGMLNSSRRWVRSDGPLTPDEIADRYVDLLLSGLGPR